MRRGSTTTIQLRRLATSVVALLAFVGSGSAQSLEEMLDEDVYLRRLSELNLPEVLDHYIEQSPPDDPVKRTLYELALMRMEMRHQNAGPARELQMIERMIELRRQLIASHPDDPRRGAWLLEQAGDLLFDLVPVDASGTTTLFGVASDDQRARVTSAAAEAHALAREADELVRRTIREIEQRPGFTSDVALQFVRRRLSERERDLRAPLLLGVSAVLRAETTQDRAARKILHDEAARVLQPLANARDGSVAARARLYRGIALARLGGHEEAAAEFTLVRSDEQAAPIDRFTAVLAQAQSEAAAGAMDAAVQTLQDARTQYAASDEVLYHVLLADAAFLAHRTAAQREQNDAARQRALAQAYGAYQELLEARLRVPPGALRSVVITRLSLVMDAQTPLQDLPPIFTVARAESLARNQATHEEAIALYERVLHELEDDRELHADALFSLGRVLHEQRRPIAAAQRFLQLAAEHPESSHAGAAIEHAAGLAAQTFRDDRTNEEARSTLERALALMFERYPDLREVNRWRYVAAQVVLEERRFDDAMTHLERIAIDAEVWLDAQFMLANVARSRMQSAADRENAEEQVERRLEMLRVIEQVRPRLAQGLERESLSSRQATLRYYLANLDIFAGAARLEMNDPQRALGELQEFDRRGPIEPEVMAEGLRLRIAAWQMDSRPEQAISEVQRFMDAAPEQVTAVLAPMLATIADEVRALALDDRRYDADERARRALLPLAKLAEQWLAGSGAPVAETVALRSSVAAAYLLAGEHSEALPRYERLADERPNALELLLGEAEAQYHVGGEENLGEAMRTYKRIAAAGPSTDPDAYWLSQLRMLQILDKVNRNTQQIVPRIQRLEQEDTAMGGPILKRDFNILRRKHGG